MPRRNGRSTVSVRTESSHVGVVGREGNKSCGENGMNVLILNLDENSGMGSSI